jgi:hypothetical protein
MALIKADRVKESSTSTGASTFALAGAYTGFRSFSSVCSVGDTFYYVIDSDLGSEWETGLGTYSAVNTLTRTTVHSSSNSNNIVTFSAGTKNVYISLTGNQLGTLSTLAGSETLTNKTINASNNTITNVSLTSGVTGTLPIANGGTGTTTAQLAMNALAGAVTSGSYLRGNGTNVVMAAISAGDVPTLNQNTTGTASGSVSGTASYLAKFTGTNVVGNSVIVEDTSSTTATLIATTNTAYDVIGLRNTNASGYSSLRIIDSAGTSRIAFGYGNSTSGLPGAYIYGYTSDGLGIYTNATQRMYIGSGGNVGIGDNPAIAYRLKVQHTGTGALQLTSTGASAASPTLNLYDLTNGTTGGFSCISGGVALGAISNHPLQLLVNATERMRIDASGNVGIGTTSPTSVLTVKAASPSNHFVRFQNTSNVTIASFYTSSAGHGQFYLYDNAGNPKFYVIAHTSAVFGLPTFVNDKLEVTSPSAATKALVVKGASAQSANLQEWQNSAGTVLAYVSSDASVIGTPSNCYIGANNNSGGQIILYGSAGGYGVGFKTTSSGNEVIRFNSGQITLTVGQGGNNAGLLVNGNLGSSGSVASFVNAGNVASKGIVVKGAASQTGNLQEWQNNAGTALATVDPAGNFSAPGGYLYGTSGAGGAFIGVSKWLGQDGTYIWIRKLYGTRAFPATNATGDYVEIVRISRNAVNPITLTVHGNSGAVYGSQGKIYTIFPDYWNASPGWVAAPSWSKGVNSGLGYSDFEIEIVAIDGNYSAIRARRTVATTPSIGMNFMFTVEMHNYNSGHIESSSVTGNSATALAYASNEHKIGPYVCSPPPVNGFGAGTNLTIAASSGSGTGSGGSIILQAGAFATSGSNGKVIVRGLASNTANLQEWQNNAGSQLSAVNSAGDFTNTGGITQSEKFGNGAVVSVGQATAIGNGASAGQLSTAVGYAAGTTGVTGVAVGAQASADGGSVAVGRQAGASGGSAIAIGPNASATGNNSITVGRLSASSGGISIGYNFTGVGLGYTSFNASTNGLSSTGAIAVYAGDGANNGNFSRQHSMLGTWSVATYASRLGRVQLRVNDYTTDREAIRYESDGANALTSIGGSAIIANTTLAVQPAVSGNKGIVVKGASGQSANLQEWQNNAGTILAQIDPAGNANLRSFGIYDYSRSGGNTADYKHHCLFRNIPDTVGDYVEIGELTKNTLWEVEVLVWRAGFDPTYGTGYNLIRKKYYLTTRYLSQGIVIPDFVSNEYSTFNDFELELVNDGNGIATRLRLRRTIAVANALTAFQAMIKIIGAATYPSGAGVSEMSGTGTSALSLAYRSIGYNTTRYSYILPPPPVGGSGSGMPLYVYGGAGVGTGSGGTVVINGGSAAGTGDGGSVFLQAGAFATSGSNGKVIVRGLASNTANLQEWQNNAGSVLSAVKSNGSIQPASMADSAATNNSIYYSTTASKLVYKDAAGTVNNLY